MSLALIVVGTAAIGQVAVWRIYASLESTVNQRVVPLKTLKEVSDIYAISVVDSVHKARNGTNPIHLALHEVTLARSKVYAAWAEYKHRISSNEERGLLASIDLAMAMADAEIDDLVLILASDDADAMVNFAATRLYPAIEPVTQKISELVELQLTLAQIEHERATALRLISLVFSLSVGVGAVLIAFAALWVFRISVLDRIAAIIGVMKSVAKDELETSVPMLERKDELGDIARAVQIFKDTAIAKNELFAKLEAAQGELIEQGKMASLGSLVAGVAHEINTPIGIGISGISAIVDKTNATARLHKDGALTVQKFEATLNMLRETSDLVQTNLIRAANLVKSFKSVAVEQHLDDVKSVNVKPFLQELSLSLSHEMKIGNHVLSVGGADDCVVQCIPSQIWQVFSNIVLNAVRHGFKKKRDGKIDVHVGREGQSAEIVIADDGRGMDAEELKQCFDPFFTTNRESGGTGLGLSIVYNIVTQGLKGRISVKSKIGEGTVFRVSLPLRQIETKELMAAARGA